MTTTTPPPIRSSRASSSSIPDEWEDLIVWILELLRAIPFPSGPIPSEWKTLLTWILTEVESAFSGMKGVSDDKWEESFRTAHENSKEKLDAGAEKVVEHIKELSAPERAPAAAWWKVAWHAITEFIVRMGKCIAGVAQTWWQRVKAWFARLKRAIAEAWASWTSSSSGMRMKC